MELVILSPSIPPMYVCTYIWRETSIGVDGTMLGGIDKTAALIGLILAPEARTNFLDFCYFASREMHQRTRVLDINRFLHLYAAGKRFVLRGLHEKLSIAFKGDCRPFR